MPEAPEQPLDITEIDIPDPQIGDLDEGVLRTLMGNAAVETARLASLATESSRVIAALRDQVAALRQKVAALTPSAVDAGSDVEPTPITSSPFRTPLPYEQSGG